ncbi:MAG: TIGR00153 family protein [Planctomycetes bacterium]|nr:TIGR00153 family protein [Planctomycetota bacterium]
MRLGSREKKVRDLIHEHLNKAKKCVKLAIQVIEVYCGGDSKKARKLADEVNAVETEADALRRQIARKLFEGAFLPMMREPLLGFVKCADGIADAAERVAETIFLTQIEIPDPFKKPLTQTAENAITAIKSLRNAFDAVFEDMSRVLELAHECTTIEHRVDNELESVVGRVFAADLSLAQKMQLHDFIEQIDDIVDATEDAADVLEILTVITSV